MIDKYEAIEAIFKLSENESIALDRLGVTDTQRDIFELFRQSFLFSSGDVAIQLSILLGALKYADSKLISEINQSSVTTETVVAFLGMDDQGKDREIAQLFLDHMNESKPLPDYLAKIPSYLLYIQAPSRHVKIGKKSSNPKYESDRVVGILKPLTIWINNLHAEKEEPILSSFNDFLDRETIFTRKSGEKSYFMGENKRATGAGLHASFLREIVLSKDYDHLFVPEIKELIQSWRAVFAIYKDFITNHVLDLDIDLITELQQWLLDLRNENKVVDDSFRPKLATIFYNSFGRLPDLNESFLIYSIHEIVNGWNKHNPNQDFFRK